MSGLGGDALLPGGRLRGAMPLVTAMMLFLATLAAAAALALSGMADRLEGGERLTVQIMATDPLRREGEARRALALLESHPQISSARHVGGEEMERLLEPWLGRGASGDLPLPALIEADLRANGAQGGISRALAAVAPSAIVNAEADWLSPARQLIDVLRWLAGGLVLLAALTTAATVALASRASLRAHADTIGLLHLIGATDRQLVRLFERRAALASFAGGMTGWTVALLVLLLTSQRLHALGDTPISAPVLGGAQLALLGLLPIGATLLAMLVARITLLRALSRTP